MTSDSFRDHVDAHFQYLVNDYGFSSVTLHDPEFYRDTVVDYKSDAIGIEIVLDRGEVHGTIGPASQSPGTWIDIASLVHFLLAETEEEPYTYPEMWYDQVVTLACFVRQYLDPVLKGEFNRWDKVVEYWQERGRARYKEQTGLDIP
jgi:hypothetical protein